MDRRAFLIVMMASACQQAGATKVDSYRWQELTSRAVFSVGHNYPVHVTADGRFVALHPEGAFETRDGKMWTPSALPVSGLNSAYLACVQHDGATYALGLHKGSYQDFALDPKIQRTSDYQRREQLGRSW